MESTCLRKAMRSNPSTTHTQMKFNWLRKAWSRRHLSFNFALSGSRGSTLGKPSDQNLPSIWLFHPWLHFLLFCFCCGGKSFFYHWAVFPPWVLLRQECVARLSTALVTLRFVSWVLDAGPCHVQAAGGSVSPWQQFCAPGLQCVPWEGFC